MHAGSCCNAVQTCAKGLKEQARLWAGEQLPCMLLVLAWQADSMQTSLFAYTQSREGSLQLLLWMAFTFAHL